jgi:hypothetical protein
VLGVTAGVKDVGNPFALPLGLNIADKELNFAIL